MLALHHQTASKRFRKSSSYSALSQSKVPGFYSDEVQYMSVVRLYQSTVAPQVNRLLCVKLGTPFEM